MGWVFAHPSLTLLEVAWRWAVGIQIIRIVVQNWIQIITVHPLEASGIASLDKQNPWVAAVQLSNVWHFYEEPVAAVLRWLVPVAVLAWAAVSGIGRNIVLRRMEPGLRLRPLAMMTLQAAWLIVLCAVFAAWFGCMRWVTATHINAGGEPDLIGFAIWAIFLSLAFFTLWALISWALTMAPLLALLENRGVLSSLRQSFLLGGEFTGKLMEINLVMGIVKLALIVLAMVFSAAPLPFSDELGPEAMRIVWMGSVIFYLVANDYFQVVRLKGFVEFWRTYRAT